MHRVVDTLVPQCPKCGEPMKDQETWTDVYDFRCLQCHIQLSRLKPPAPVGGAREFFNHTGKHLRWRFFEADKYRPAGMSPRKDGEWVKYEDAEAYAAEKVREAQMIDAATINALRTIAPFLRRALKREINSPANHQEFARESREMLDQFERALAYLKSGE